jgi:hypothetical protein
MDLEIFNWEIWDRMRIARKASANSKTMGEFYGFAVFIGRVISADYF